MMQFASRPTEGQADYEEKAKPHQDALKALKKNGEPDYAAINEYIDAHQIWGDVKPFFMKAQFRKCGFCEVKITEAPGDVEHYRPKNAHWQLEAPGQERNDLVNVSGRKFKKVFDSGYWWLTYSWDNYLIACGTCNQKWKSALFPLKPQRRRRPQPGDETNETPLLLDPFGDRAPSDHLRFSDLGQIEPIEGSEVGKGTIETCGLDRESLRSSREEKAIRAHHLVRALATATADAIKVILRDIREMGRLDYPHAGMVRAIFEQGSGLKWQQLEDAILTP